MDVQGHRLHVDLDNHTKYDHVSDSSNIPNLKPGFHVDLVGDIKERVASAEPRPPSPPRFKTSKTGFPAHKSRLHQFKVERKEESQTGGLNGANVGAFQSGTHRLDDSDGIRQKTATSTDFKDPSIDQENKQRLAAMSDQEIEEARQELMTGLSPSLIEKLLKKANIDDGQTDSSAVSQELGEKLPLRPKSDDMKVTFESEDPALSDVLSEPLEEISWDPEAAPLYPPPDLQPASRSLSALPNAPNIHFPSPPQAPDLDPSDPDFLSALHSTYFPKLPADPSAMAWMAPLDPKAEEESFYSPSQQSFPASALRFDFRGHLLPPRLSAQIPSTKGLHHHAHAPSSAGYTVPELTHLARSTYPAQRCIAYQTLGRILYRLGRGDFGQEGEDLCEGLWQLMDLGKVIDQLIEAAAKGDSGNRSVWVTATDAVWLWRKGGGRKWKGR